jgi:hypothetical protein
MSSFVLGFTSCGHNHEQSPVMKEVVEINVRLWEDLNSAKAEVRSRIEKVTTITNPLDSVREEKVSIELKLLMDQKLALESLDKIIPELKGYEPKCNHEPGEAHSHNTVDIDGLDEKELLEIHKELTSTLTAIKDNLKK